MSVEPGPDVAKRMAQFFKVRDAVTALKKKHEEELKPYAEALKALNNALLQQLYDSHVDSFSVRGVGTVYKNTKTSATIADQEAFRNWVIANQAWDYTDWRANAPRITQHLVDGNDNVPGVNYKQFITVGARVLNDD